jgi:hypothetical protein
MNHMTPNGPPYQWEFCLVDEKPGPAVGDAVALIESLGFDPWLFSSLALVSESCVEKLAICEFAVAGPRLLVDALRAAHACATGSATAPSHLAPGYQDAGIPG